MASGVTADDYIKTCLLVAKQELAAFTHQPIIEALKFKPDGVGTEEFLGIEHKGINLANWEDVAVAMKKNSPIMYHLPSGEYRMAPRAHRMALSDIC